MSKFVYGHSQYIYLGQIKKKSNIEEEVFGEMGYYFVDGIVLRVREKIHEKRQSEYPVYRLDIKKTSVGGKNLESKLKTVQRIGTARYCGVRC
jgi:hypothetical protein